MEIKYEFTHWCFLEPRFFLCLLKEKVFIGGNILELIL